MKKENGSNIFVIVIFVVIVIMVLLFPKVYNLIEKSKLPQVEKPNNQEETEVKKEVDSETLESLNYPIMRNSIYNENTYFSLKKFRISDMSNQDILYNAFLDVYEGNITSSKTKGRCTNSAKEFNAEYLELRIKNILGKNVSYTLEDFTVAEDSGSNYPGSWSYDSNGSKYIYNGLCKSQKSNIVYIDLKQFIKAEYDNNDIIVYYYIGFAKVNSSDMTYTIYKDANLTTEISNGEILDITNLDDIFKSINKSNKQIYKYTFKNTLCSYNDYCLYGSMWVNEL